MNPEITFTQPSEHITAARQALARLECHFDDVVGALDPTADLTTLALATLTMETVNPPYPPLECDDTWSTCDPRADLAAAIAALKAASVEAETARDTLRLAHVICDLRDLQDSPYLDVASTGGPGSRP